MNTQPLILFDFGAVLINLNFDRLGKRAEELSNGRLSPQEFLRQYSETGLEKDYLLGNISTNEFVQKLEGILGNQTIGEEELRKFAVSHLDDVITDMLDLKQSLISKGHQVGILSNAGELHYEHALKRFPQIYANADPLILSFQRHLVKPGPAIYQLLSDYSNVIFIDDNSTYVLKGIEFGWKGIVYLGNIDSSEPQRKRDEQPSQISSMRIAYSAKEVRQHLNEFGLAI